jgi:hypothetical protein
MLCNELNDEDAELRLLDKKVGKLREALNNEITLALRQLGSQLPSPQTPTRPLGAARIVS